MVSVRFLFVDLDTLLTSVQTHVQSQPTVFAQQLALIPSSDMALDPQKLTTLLEGTNSLVISRRGAFFNPFKADAIALRALGWDMKKKGALFHRTFENLLDKTYQDSGVCGAHENKTVALAAGDLTPAILSVLDAFLQGNWRVQLYILQRCWQPTFEQLKETFGIRFEVIYIDVYISSMLTNRKFFTPTVVQSPTSAPHGIAPPQPVSVAGRRPMALQSPPLPTGRAAIQFTPPQEPPKRSRAAGVAPSPARGTPQNRNNRPGSAANAPRDPRPAIASNLPSTGNNNPARSTPANQNNWRNVDLVAAAQNARNLVQKRRGMLQALPPSRMPYAHHQRFVFMDLDNIWTSFTAGHHLCAEIPGATSTRDLHVNFQTLTDRVCGTNPDLVVRQVATYFHTYGSRAQGLTNFRWQVMKQETASDTTLQLELLSQLMTSTTNSKTLVLVTGDGNLAPNNKSFKEIINKYLQHNWCVEIHAWLHSINEGYIKFQEQYPDHVVVRPLDDVLQGLVYLRSSVGTATSVNNATVGPVVQATPAADIAMLTQNIREVQQALQALQAGDAERLRLQEQNARLAHQIQTQESQVEAERARHHATLNARLEALTSQATALTCPLTLELFENPMTVSCCGKTFSGPALERSRQVRNNCPMCRHGNFTTTPNRDITYLVEHYISERTALENDLAAVNNSSQSQGY